MNTLLSSLNKVNLNDIRRDYLHLSFIGFEVGEIIEILSHRYEFEVPTMASYIQLILEQDAQRILDDILMHHERSISTTLGKRSSIKNT